MTYAKVCLVAGFFILLASTWATLQVEQKSNVAEKPMPKDGPFDKPALKSLEKLEEKVLNANLNISAFQKLDNIADLAAKGKDKEAAQLLKEMKLERKEQEALMKKQEELVQELHKHAEEHAKAQQSGEKGGNKVKKDKRDSNQSATEMPMPVELNKVVQNEKNAATGPGRNTSVKREAVLKEKERIATTYTALPKNAVNSSISNERSAKKGNVERREA